VRQPIKKKYLSGDACSFESPGKEICRQLWLSYSYGMANRKRTTLNYLWLANNQLTDIKPLVSTGHFTIPDNNASNRAAKRKTLVRDFGMKKRNGKIYIVDSFDAVVARPATFDVINIDSCSHLDEETLNNLHHILSFNTEANAFFFTTFTQSSMRSVLQNRFPEFKRISGDRTEISKIVEKLFEANGYFSSELSGFPLTYTSGDKRKQTLYSFGWELNRV
jgi:hypothetical protein